MKPGIALEALAIFLLALAFTAAQLHVSSCVGRLSSIPAYDDVAYLNDASRIYYLAKTDGLATALGFFFTGYQHSPFVIANAVAGHVLFGPHVRLIYFMLTLVVAAYLAGVAYFARGLPLLLRAGLVSGSLGIPFATLCAVEFRPDLMWATVLGVSGVAFLASEWPFARRRSALLYGSALGLALLVKPSTFAMTLLVLGGVWILAAAIALATRSATPGLVARGFGLSTLAAALVAGWYLVPHAGDVFAYFYKNSFGDYKDVWSFKSGQWDQWTYYARGFALASNLGLFALPLLALGVAGPLRDIFYGRSLCERLRGGAFLWMLAGLFVVNAAFGMKSVYLGGSFYGFAIFAGLWQASRLLQECVARGWLAGWPRQTLLGGACAAAALLSIRTPPAGWANNVVRDAQLSVNKGVLERLLAEKKPSLSLVVVQGGPLIWEYLQMECRRRGVALAVRDAKMATDASSVLARAENADFIALQDSALAGSPGDAIPGERLQPALIAHFGTNPQWHLAGRYSDQAGKFAYLYARGR